MQPALGFLTKLSLLKCATVLSNATFSCSTRCTRLTVLWCGHLEPYSTATVPRLASYLLASGLESRSPKPVSAWHRNQPMLSDAFPVRPLLQTQFGFAM